MNKSYQIKIREKKILSFRPSETWGIIFKGLTNILIEGETKCTLKGNDRKFPKFGEDIHLWIQEDQQTLNRINAKKTVTRHIMIKLLNNQRYRENLECN